MSIELALARIKLLLWTVLVKLPLAVIYVVIIADGLRYLIPPLGQKLWKIPLLTFLREYEAFYRLDLAPFMSIFILLAVWHFWDEILEILLVRQTAEGEWVPDNRALLVMTVGAVILGADVCLFYIGISQSSWGGTGFSVSALLATTAYLGVLIFVSYRSLDLRLSLRELCRE